MIKAEVLRIGNIIEYAGNGFRKGYTRVNGDILFGIEESDEGSYNPIHLTKKILKKCGLRLDTNKGFDSDSDCKYKIYSIWDDESSSEFNIAIVGYEFYLWIEIDSDQWYNYKWTKIDFLHQLQNLYFAITGKELKTNLLNVVSRINKN